MQNARLLSVRFWGQYLGVGNGGRAPLIRFRQFPCKRDLHIEQKRPTSDLEIAEIYFRAAAQEAAVFTWGSITTKDPSDAHPAKHRVVVLAAEYCFLGIPEVERYFLGMTLQ